MALATPVDREFKTNPAGYIRDHVVLANYREGLRALVNPETGQAFTEEEIARATRSPGRWYVEAQAIDDYGQQQQRNALYLADQVRFDRATGKWLFDYHGKTWDVTPLPASGSSGPVRVPGTAGTIVLGSTTIGDPNAYTARDPAGNLYQVFGTTTIPASGEALVTLAAVGTGSATNIKDGTVLTWSTRDPNMKATAVVDGDFLGGTDDETSEEFASRLGAIIRYRPGAGNDPQVRAWGRESSNAVEDAFVYPCALHAGSQVVAITQKRGKGVGPLARIPSASTIQAARAYLTPPTSPVQPTGPFVIVPPAKSDPVNLTMRLGLERASAGGWRDSQPFPSYHATPPQVVAVGGGVFTFAFTASGDATLPGQVAGATVVAPNCPRLMLWNVATSSWEELVVQQIVHSLAPLQFNVTLVSSPTFDILVGQYVSPATRRKKIIAQALQDHFDELGPGDFFDTDNDSRGARCQRFPSYLDERPIDTGAEVVTDVLAALGGTSRNGTLGYISKTSPSFNPAFQLGPNMLTLGNVGIYDL